MTDTGSSDARGRKPKIPRLLGEYDLAGLGDELETRWTAEGDERRSLRDLTAYFNKELLRAALTAPDVDISTEQYDGLYRSLTGEDVSEAERTRVRRRLDRAGVEVETLERDFVSFQAIRTYLNDYRGVEYEGSDTDSVESARDHLQRLTGRLTAVASSRLEQLGRRDDFTLGSVNVLVDVNVVCEECNARYELSELLSRAGCDCEQ